MDYKKKYEEALEIAKKIHSGNGIDAPSDWTTLEIIFPELRETEDERIRKELIFFLKEEIPQCSIKEHADKLNEFVSYLEKQKPVECIKFDNEFVDQVSHLIASVLNGEHEYNEGFVKYVAQSLLGYAKKEQNNVTINGEPIPTENQSVDISMEWSEEDELHRKSIISTIEMCMKDNERASAVLGYYYSDIAWLKSLRPVKQKWSEEDEDMLNSCISSIEESKENRYYYQENDGGTFYDMEIAWLKSLRKRISLQPKQEWTDEDEEILRGIKQCVYENVANIGTVNKTKYIDWLESLGPYKKP